jgi:hypothetical protein
MRGGSIAKNVVFQKILSIGFEVECGVLAKLTKTDDDEETGDAVLYNADTARKDIQEFKKVEAGEDDDVDDYILERQEEVMEDDIHDKNGKRNANAVFNITSDNAVTPFIQMLNKICYYDSELDLPTDKSKTEEKNHFFTFRTDTGKNYNIHFKMKDDTDCGFHSSVEWVVTYYKIQRSKNVIVDTFVNMITNLVAHLSDLEEIKGNYIVKYKTPDDEIEEFVVKNPKERILFHKPDTSLYYLQTQKSSIPMTIDDACSVVQMTFSSYAEDIVDVLVALLTDNADVIPTFHSEIEEKLEHTMKLKKCVDELVNNYNKTASMYYFYSNTKKNTKFVDIVKSYLFLIIFKIERYIFFKTRPKRAKYFKNLLYFNSRHSNYVLYTNLKREIKSHFGIDDDVVVSLIKTMICVPSVWERLGLPVSAKVFSKEGALDKMDVYYGDPKHSVASYLDFFEAPIDDETNIIEDTGRIVDYDWLEYNGIDDVSNKMELKNNVVLVECRNFQKLLALYVYNMADKTLRKQMTRGACNILTEHIGSDVSSMSIANFKKIIEIYNKTGSTVTKYGTRKKTGRSTVRKTRSKSPTDSSKGSTGSKSSIGSK